MKKMFRKTVLKKTASISLILVVAITSSAFFSPSPLWKAPASADSKKNPLPSNAKTVEHGRQVYIKECQSCHGKKGKGDGPSAAQLGVPAGDFTKASTQQQSDGAIFWKVSEGRKPMPSFKKKLGEDDIWHLVNYMRTLK